MKRLDFLTKTVIFVLSFLSIFTVACFISNHINGLGQDTLIQWVFTVFGVELLAMMVKKILDKWYGSQNNDEEMML